MEIRQLTTFVRVAQFQSFSKAAASLGYSQSAVTVQIRLLEQELGVRLFDRISKRVILTAHGRQFLESAYTILQDINRAALALAQDGSTLTGQLHIGTLESLCFARLPGVIQTFRTKHPAVKLQITTGIPEELIRKMEQGEVDIIYILDEPIYSNNWHKLMEQPEEIVMAASVALESALPQGPHRLEELLDLPFYLTERDANYRRMFDRRLAALGRSVTPVLESSSASFLLHVLENTQGLSYLPRFLVEEKVRQGNLRIIELEDLQTTMYCQIFCHKEKWVTREMQKFVRFCRISNRFQANNEQPRG